MNSRILQAFQRELTCPICMNYFIDPVTIDCGHSFCRPCFYLNWQDIEVLCSKRNLNTNICLKNMASIARKASLWQFLSSEEQICGTHRRQRRCSVKWTRHQNHRHCPTESAAEEHQNYVSLSVEAIRAECQKMRAFPHEEEQHHLERLRQEGEDIFQQLNESKARMEHSRELLREMYEDLKQMCHKADVELLQAFGDILHMFESLLLRVSEPVNTELSSVGSEPERANSHIVLYRDLRSMNVGCAPQDDPHITAKSECFPVWGAQAFISGKYYWEVHVGDSWNWMERRDSFFLDVLRSDTHCSLFTTSQLVVQYVPRPTSTVGLFLDCEGRTMSFVDVDQSSLIYTIPNCSFSPPLRPIFCCSHF
uniref:RING-type domain-containing protein n=1 Tax=Nomascus leucogenys TaxID=61853 RepID=A0A2I3H487_NOMLE